MVVEDVGVGATKDLTGMAAAAVVAVVVVAAVTAGSRQSMNVPLHSVGCFGYAEIAEKTVAVGFVLVAVAVAVAKTIDFFESCLETSFGLNHH